MAIVTTPRGVGATLLVLLCVCFTAVASQKLRPSAALPRAARSTGRRACGTHQPGPAQEASNRKLEKILEARKAVLRRRRASPGNLYSIAGRPHILVPVKFVVLHDGAKGKATRGQLDKQVAVLNNAFSGSQAAAAGASSPDAKIAFRLESAQWVNDAVNYKKCTKNNMAIQKKYVTSPEQFVYVIVCASEDLGASTLPQDYQERSWKHAIEIATGTLPDGAEEDYNLGDTLVHEMGHYFGLEHTFQGEGCDGKGDFVDDTPVVKRANKRCRVVDSCPNHRGNDMVENFMDYAPDTCMERFTPGQSAHAVTGFGPTRSVLLRQVAGFGQAR